MRSYKEILNDAAKHGIGLRELSTEESAALKRCLLDIYQEIARICKAYHLVMMLGGGSCLGAVRHQGFIPWDDDLDLLMPREDYDRLLELCKSGELGDNYFISYPNKEKDSPSMFLKIYRKGTLMKGLGASKNVYPQECFVDVFPIEGMSDLKSLRKLKGIFANCLRFIANTVAESGKITEAEKVFFSSDKYLWKYFCIRRIIGRFFSVVPHKKWVCMYDSFVRNNSKTKMVGIPTGRKLYDGESFDISVYFPPSKGIFEKMEVNLPSNTDKYLTNLYHQYMELPPEDKRERHFFTEFSVPNNFYKNIV